MNQSQWSAFAPGKLVLCGEYAVLEPGGEGLVLAVNAGVRATFLPASDTRVWAPALADVRKLVCDAQGFEPAMALPPGETAGLRFALEALNTGLTWLRAKRGEAFLLQPFHLALENVGQVVVDARSGPLKVGMGSSAAATVATLAGFLALQGALELQEDGSVSLEAQKWLYELAFVSHRRAQGGRGSGIDVAASVYGGLVWFRQTEEGPFGALPEVFPVQGGEQLSWVAGWAGHSSATSPRVGQVQAWASAHPAEWQAFVETSRGATQIILAELQQMAANPDSTASHLPEPILAAIEAHRMGLLELGRQTGLVMETAALEVVAAVGERYGAGKQSGAGGGDCGIVVLREGRTLPEARKTLQLSGVTPLDLRFSPRGVTVLSAPDGVM